MTTTDTSGNIHAGDGKFAGHIRPDAEGVALDPTSTFDNSTRFAVEQRVVFRVDGDGEPEPGTISEAVDADPTRTPNGGEFFVDLDGGGSVIAYWTELTDEKESGVITRDPAIGEEVGKLNRTVTQFADAQALGPVPLAKLSDIAADLRYQAETLEFLVAKQELTERIKAKHPTAVELELEDHNFDGPGSPWWQPVKIRDADDVILWDADNGDDYDWAEEAGLYDYTPTLDRLGNSYVTLDPKSLGVAPRYGITL